MKFIPSTIAAVAAFGVAAVAHAADPNKAHEIVKVELLAKGRELNGMRIVTPRKDGVIDVIDVVDSGMNAQQKPTELCAKFYDLRKKRAIEQDQPDVVCINVQEFVLTQ